MGLLGPDMSGLEQITETIVDELKKLNSHATAIREQLTGLFRGADHMTDEDRELLIDEYQSYKTKAVEAIRKERTERYGKGESKGGTKVEGVAH